MRAILAFCRRFALDLAAVFVGWTALDLAWAWYEGAPIARVFWVAYLLPTAAAALTASFSRLLRPGPPPQPTLPGSAIWKTLFSVDWVDLLSLLAAYEAAERLPSLVRSLAPAEFRLPASLVLAVALGLAAAYLLHRLLAQLALRLAPQAEMARAGRIGPPPSRSAAARPGPARLTPRLSPLAAEKTRNGRHPLR